MINSPILKDLIGKLLEKNPKDRLGYHGTKEIKGHPWFKTIQWENILNKKLTAPFIPKMKSEIDTSWFELENEGEFALSEEESQLGDHYKSFSLSWKSSERGVSPQEASPPSPSSPVMVMQPEMGVDEFELN